MTTSDPNNERQRLAQLYAAMRKQELAEIAEIAGSSTEIAKDALRAEISRRGLEIELDELAVTREDVQYRKLVTLRRFRDLPEAHIAKSILDSAGIECFLGDVNVIWMHWFYSNLLGGIKLWVKPEDVEAAGGMLEQSVVENFDAGGTKEYRQPRCPDCHSAEVSFQGLNERIAHTLGLIGLPIPLKDSRWKCHSCGHEWQEPDEIAV